MKNINFPMLLLAILVILLFSSVGVAIAIRNVWATFALFVLAFFVMGYGMSLKKNKQSDLK